MVRWIWLPICLLLVVSGADAQDATPTEPPPLMTYGQIVTGRLDNRNPLATYQFDGLRGEYVNIQLTATSGNLDAVLTVLDDTGTALVTLDDTKGSANPTAHQVRIPYSGRYTIVVGRFGYALGSTSGEYELTIQRIGVSFESGSALRYGDTVVNTITSTQTEIYYSFTAERGDIITLTMRRDSGDLDPSITIVDSNRRIIAQNDDMIGSQDSRIEGLIIEESGAYLIIATRYDGTGEFFLTLARADNSGVGVSAEVAVRLQPGRPTEGEITEQRYQIFYSFTAKRDDIITIRMNRISGGGFLDCYVSLTNAGLQELASNDDVAEGNQNSQIAEYRIPADGTYYIIASRFEGAAGLTTGRFRIELISLGNAFDEVATDAERLVYGTTITGRIDNTTSTHLYAFYGVQGDVITSSLNRTDGNLLPTLELLDARQQPISAAPTGEANARIERYTLPRTGVYYLRATRVLDSGTTGGFILVLAQRFD